MITRDDEFMGKYAFIVMVLGYWGCGDTIKAAALKCKQEGAKGTDKAIVLFYVGDDKPEVDSNGYTLREQGAVEYKLLKGIQLRRLTQLA